MAAILIFGALLATPFLAMRFAALRAPRREWHIRPPEVTPMHQPWESDPDAWRNDATGTPKAAPIVRRLDCPLCAARNAERQKHGLEPLRHRFQIRSRDSAIYCYAQDEAMYRMPLDSVIRYDPRYHRGQPPEKRAA